MIGTISMSIRIFIFKIDSWNLEIFFGKNIFFFDGAILNLRSIPKHFFRQLESRDIFGEEYIFFDGVILNLRNIPKHFFKQNKFVFKIDTISMFMKIFLGIPPISDFFIENIGCVKIQFLYKH